MSSMLEKLKSFIKEAEKHPTYSEWLEDDQLKVFVRKSVRFLDGARRTMFDIGSVEVVQEKRGNGIFTDLLVEIMKINPYDGIYIENVLDERFAAYFRRQGWREIPQEELGIPTFYALL